MCSSDLAATDKLVRNLADYPDISVVRCRSAAEAARGADIITTVTADKAMATVVTPDMIEPGMHINGVGGDCPGKTEIHADVVRAAKVFVEFEPQTRVEGDIQQLPADWPVNHLWQVLSGTAAGRDDEGQVTFFDSVGFAIEDFSALEYIHRAAISMDLGRDIELVPLQIGRAHV